jgi:DNA (cytosine-5)-methyltransferase 1
VNANVRDASFPDAEHYCGDVAKADIAKFPRADLYWSSPSCPPWTDARSVHREPATADLTVRRPQVQLVP